MAELRSFVFRLPIAALFSLWRTKLNSALHLHYGRLGNFRHSLVATSSGSPSPEQLGTRLYCFLLGAPLCKAAKFALLILMQRLYRFMFQSISLTVDRKECVRTLSSQPGFDSGSWLRVSKVG